MTPQQCNTTWQRYILSGVVFGIVLIIFVLIIVCIRRVRRKRQKWSYGNSVPSNKKWKRIEYLSKKEETRPLAIIYACSLLDCSLKTHGYPGGTLSERLIAAQIAAKNSDISSVLQLHNEIVYDPEMKP